MLECAVGLQIALILPLRVNKLEKLEDRQRQGMFFKSNAMDWTDIYFPDSTISLITRTLYIGLTYDFVYFLIETYFIQVERTQTARIGCGLKCDITF